MDLPAAVLEPGRVFILRLLASLLVLSFGWITAKLLKGLVFRALLTARFDVASEKAGIDDVLRRADIRQSPAELVAVLVYWLVLLASLVGSVSTLGLTQVSELLSRCLVYAPKIIAAVLVLILGLFLASFLAGVVRAAAVNAGMAESGGLATLVRYAVVAFTAAVTLEELGIAPELVRSAFVILFGAVALALALAFGLGCKDLAREWMVRYLDTARARRKPH
jgi:flagellar biosynthesis protein FliQ